MGVRGFWEGVVEGERVSGVDWIGERLSDE